MELVTLLIMRYLVCGVFAWVICFTAWTIYLINNLGLDLIEFRAFRRFLGMDDDKNSKLSAKVISKMAFLWPYEVICVTNELTNNMTRYLKAKSR